MASKMKDFARNWKAPEERSAAKKMAENKASEKKAGSISAKAPANTTGKKAMKNSADSKDGGSNGWKKGATKQPSGC